MNKTKNFIISETKKGDIIVTTKTYDWKLRLAATSQHGQILKFFIENNSEEEINELLNMVYYTSVSMFIDMKLTKHIRDFFDQKIQDAEILEEVSEEEEIENLKIIKDGLQDTKTTSTDADNSND